MEKVYKALYKTDWIYADGFIVIHPDKTIEGIFALDYMYIYESEKNDIVFLKTLDYYRVDELIMQDIGIYEFYSSKQIFYPYNVYFFFDSSDNGLFLEIKEEITDANQIQDILLEISQSKA